MWGKWRRKLAVMIDTYRLNRKLKNKKFVKKAMTTVDLRRRLLTIEKKIDKLEEMRKHSSGEKLERIDTLLESLRATREGIRKSFLEAPSD